MAEVQIDRIVMDLNTLALENLNKGNPKACVHLLRRAQDLLATPDFPDSKNRLSALTYNNLGCYYKSIKKFTPALSFFQKAFDLKSDEILDKSLSAEIHINVCYIREAFLQYEPLLFHAKTALELLNKAQDTRKDLSPLAFLFIGKALKGLDQLPQASKFFKQGLEIAYKELGHADNVTGCLLQAYLEVTSKSENPVPLPKFPVTAKAQNSSRIFNEKKQKFNKSKLDPLSSRRPSRKNVFEPMSARASQSRNRLNEDGIKKVTHAKCDSKIVDGLYFDESFDNKPKSHKKKNCNACIIKDDKIIRRSYQPASRSKHTVMTPMPETRFKAKPPSSMKPAIIGNMNNDGITKVMSDSRKIKTRIESYSFKNPEISMEKDSPRNFPKKIRRENTFISSARPHKINFSENSAENEKKIQKIPVKVPNYVDKVIMIQRFWRFYQRSKARQKRIEANDKAHKAIAEFEELKKLAMMDNYEVPEFVSSPMIRTKTRCENKKINEKNMHEYALMIQKNVRRYLASKRYKRIKRLSIKIQRWYRMFVIKDLYQSIRSAIIFIQRFWRQRKVKTLI